MRKLFRPLKKSESSTTILFVSKILKYFSILIGAAGGIGLVIIKTTSIESFLFYALVALLSYIIIVVVTLYTEVILVGLSIIVENQYKNLENNYEKPLPNKEKAVTKAGQIFYD